jgi:hypothetical protein
VRQISANRSCSKRAFYFKTASSFTVTPWWVCVLIKVQNWSHSFTRYEMILF